MSDRFRVPSVEMGRVVCRCGCHDTCHLCGRPFLNDDDVHVNCADTIGSGISYSWTKERTKPECGWRGLCTRPKGHRGKHAFKPSNDPVTNRQILAVRLLAMTHGDRE